jgi:hypothetical protein
MKNKTEILLLVVFPILLVVLFSGCQKIINVDLNDAAPSIVIEGLITDNPGPYSITISRSGSFFNQPDLPFVSEALVIITDNVGSVDTLKEAKPGVYLTSNTIGVPGRTYNLKVISENYEYSGSTIMFSHVEIDSLVLSKSPYHHFDYGGDNQDEIDAEIDCYFKDPFEKNYYRIKVLANDTIRTENYRLFDDQYTNGQIIGLRVARPNADHTYRVELYSLDKLTFGFYRTLEDLVHSNPVFGSTPSNPTSNLSNGALGYFGACAVSHQTIFITDSMLKALK